MNLLDILPRRRRARRKLAAECLRGKVRLRVWRMAESAREKFKEDHQRLPVRGDWASTERAIRAWNGVLYTMQLSGFSVAKELPADFRTELQIQFGAIFVGESPLPGEA